MDTVRNYVQHLIKTGERELTQTALNMWGRQRVEGGLDQLRLVLKKIDLGGGANEKSKGDTESDR